MLTAARPCVRTETDFVILGAGMTGLAAASLLGDRAIVLERAARPGGLVRTDYVDGFWLDHVLHLLHFSDAATEQRVHRLLGTVLARCPPTAWVETAAGVTRYPIQLHLAALDPEQIARCLTDLAAAGRGAGLPAANYEDYLLRTFGRGLCDVFMLPYNRKLWKRPLRELATSGFTWNIAVPDLEAVVRGATDAHATSSPYNANGWYPRPPAGAPWRGMEVLSRALASEVHDLRLEHTVVTIDSAARVVRAIHRGGSVEIRFRVGCLSTLPLPGVIGMCIGAPPPLKAGCAGLQRNRVVTVMLGVRGPRPVDCGLWRYYADESLCFHRLAFQHAFDLDTAPAACWGLLVEITQRGEAPLVREHELLDQVRCDLQRARVLPAGSRIVLSRVKIIDPAYVVFSLDSETVVAQARRYLEDRDITPLGRFGRWEYSSMAQNLRDGFAWADARTVS